MPPWLDWLDWLKWDCIGAGTLGKILGVWFGFFISLFRKLLRWTLSTVKTATLWTSKTRISRQHRVNQPGSSFLRKLTKVVVSTLLTLTVWLAITWKPVWSAAGIEGDRVLTLALILTSAAWPISVLWILFSKPRDKNISRMPQMPPPRY